MADADDLPGAAFGGRDANHALSFRRYNASKHAQYFTPRWLTELLKQLLWPLVPPGGAAGISVLDPTCGSGRFLQPWKEAGAQVLGIELDELAARNAASALGAAAVRTGDLLDYRHILSGFSLVLTNPPYGIYWTPPDPGEVWTCRTSGGLIESQAATLEVCARALAFGGYLVAILPTSTFSNLKDRPLRDELYIRFDGLLQITLPRLFEEEYGIAVDVDLLVARRAWRSSAVAWEPFRATADPSNRTEVLREAFRQLSRGDYVPLIPASFHAPVPAISRLFTVSASDAVRVTPKGVAAAADATGLLAFLDQTETAFDPVRGLEHGLVTATLSPASLVTLGAEAALDMLESLGFAPTISAKDTDRIARRQERFRLHGTPIYPPKPHQRLAYIEDRAYTAKATVKEGETVLFTSGQRYHLRPSWVRHREVAKVETAWDEGRKREVTITTSVDRGYLSLSVVTDTGPRQFREIAVEEIALLTAAFELPEVPDLEATVPRSVEHNRRIVAKRCPFLYPYQQEDVARLAVKNSGLLAYEMGAGKTVTAASWAAVRGFRRVLVICTSGLVPNWLHELDSFGYDASRLTTHASVKALLEDKRQGRLPGKTTFYITSYEFLALAGPRIYDPWTCRSFTKDGAVQHEVTDNRKGTCLVCKRAYEAVVTSCPSCGEEAAWTGGHCRTCGHQAWSVTKDARQWPAYKRLKKLFGAVLVDEAQIAKSKNTLRGRAVRALRPKGRLILTGTPMKGYPIDTFWNLSWLLGFDTPLFLYPYRGGAKRFLDEFGTTEFVTRQFEETLHEGRAKLLPETSNLGRFWKILARVCVRRLKDEVLTLPEKRRQVFLLPLDPAHEKLYGDYEDWAKTEIRKALHSGDGNPNMGVISNALWKLRYAATCPVAATYLDRGALTSTTWNKLEKIRALVTEAFARGEKTIVFSGLRSMVSAVVTHLTRAGLRLLPITAEVPAARRFELLAAFARDPAAAAIVASLNCLNRGFTITCASNAIISDLEYSPEATAQAEDRIHRPGQVRPVTISYLLSADTIDEVMHEILHQKSEAIRHAIDGHARFTDVAELLRSVTGDVQLEIARRIERLEPTRPAVETPADAASLSSVTAPELSPPVSVPLIETIDVEADGERRRFWERVAAERRASRRTGRRSGGLASDGGQSSLFD